MAWEGVIGENRQSTLSIPTYWFVAGFLYIVGVMYTVSIPPFLPDVFSYDSSRISEATLDPSAPYSKSDIRTAIVYSYIGLSASKPFYLVSAFGWTIGFGALLLGLSISRCHSCILSWALVIACSLPMATFLAFYAKEMLTVVVAALLLYSYGVERFRWFAVAFGLLVFISYGLFVRDYWLLIALFTIYLLLTKALCIGWSLAVLGLLFVYILTSITYSHFGGSTTDIIPYLSDGRTFANIDRVGSPDATTMISNLLVNSSVITDTINTLTGSLRLIFPLELFRHGEIQHLAYAIWQLVITTLLIVFISRLVHYKKMGLLRSSESKRMTVSLSFIISFVLIQGAFEPDFGSSARHQITILPFLVYLGGLYSMTSKRRRQVGGSK